MFEKLYTKTAQMFNGNVVYWCFLRARFELVALLLKTLAS